MVNMCNGAWNKTQSVSSLQHYNEAGVLDTMYTFKDGILTFQSLSEKIFRLKQNLSRSWGGRAHTAFADQFESVFSQVRDVESALGDIFEMLNKAQLEFYKTDDAYSQQLKQAAANTGKPGGGSEGKKGDWREQAGEPFIPDLIYPPLPRVPVLVSTMGEAYIPDLSYQRLRPKPVLSSCLPSMLLIILIYQSLDVKEVVAHNVAAALEILLNYQTLDNVAVLVSTIGEAYFPDFMYASPARKEVLESIIGAAVISEITKSLLDGSTKEETITRIGEAVLNQLDGNYSKDLRDILVQKIGEAIYNDLYGGGTGSTGGTEGGGIGSISDYSSWTNDTVQELVDQAVLDGCIEWLKDILLPPPPRPFFPPFPHFPHPLPMPPCRPMWLTVASDIVQPPVLIMPNPGVGNIFSGLDGGGAGQVAGVMADYLNKNNIEQMVLTSIKQHQDIQLTQSFVLNPTRQVFSQGTLTAVFEPPADTSSPFGTLDQFISGLSNGSAPNSGIIDTAKSWASLNTSFDFSHAQFPVAANL